MAKIIQRISLVLILIGFAICAVWKPGSNTTEASMLALEANGQVMGTTWSAKAFTDHPDMDDQKLKEIIQTRLDKIDLLMSTYKKESELSRFNQTSSTDWFPVSSETAEVVSLALDISRETNGAFDITVGPLVNLWKFGPNKTPLKKLPTLDEIMNIKKTIGWQNLEVRQEPMPALRKKIPNLYVDLSAIAKGFAVDQAAKVLLEEKIDDFMIEVGGEIFCHGMKRPIKEKPSRWILGIEQPTVSENYNVELYRTVQLSNAALATSGDYHNYRIIHNVRFSHIIDPRTGRPTEILEEDKKDEHLHLGSVSVILESCARADAWATAFFVLGTKEGLAIADRLEIPVLFVCRKGTDQVSTPQETSSKAFHDSISSTIVNR